MPTTLIAAGAAVARLWAVVGTRGHMIAVSVGSDGSRAAASKTTAQRADFLTKALPVGAFRAAVAFVYPDYEFAKL